MPGMNVPLVNFTGGEIGVEAHARVDLDVYPSCADTMVNCLPLMQGPMIKAPGSEYIGRTQQDQPAIVRPFIFNIDETRVLEISGGRIDLVNGNAYVDVVDSPGVIGVPADNASAGGSFVNAVGQLVQFFCSGSGDAAAYWGVTGAIAGSPITVRFQVERRPLNIRVGTSATAADIALPGPPGTFDITYEPGVHTLTFTPPTSTFFFRARLRELGHAVLRGLTVLRAGRGADGFYIPTPWPQADLSRLRYRQSLDTFWLYHPNYRTRVLERRGNTSWSLRLFAPHDGPFDQLNTTPITMTPSQLTGRATVVASEPVFSSIAGESSVGQLLEITHRGQHVIKLFSGLDDFTDAIRVSGLSGSTQQRRASQRQFQIILTGTFGPGTTVVLQRSFEEVDWITTTTFTAVTNTPADDQLDNQIIFYRLLVTSWGAGSTVQGELVYANGETTGRGEIVTVNSTIEVELDIFQAFGATKPSTLWSLGTWSEKNGWPAAGAIDDGRHCLVRDDRFWASVSDDYESFLIGTLPDEALARRFGTGEMNSSRWIESGRRLLIGTNGAEIEVSSNALDEPIGPLNNRLRGFDDNGSADTQAMKGGGNRVLFVDRSRTKLFQALFDEQSADQHATDDLTRLHNDIAGLITTAQAEAGEGGFVEIAVQRRPEPRVWCVRADGELAVMLFGPREGVYSWSRVTGALTRGGAGKFKSVCVVPGTPEDRVHVVIERVINGVTRMHHERFALQRFAIDVSADGLRSAPDAWRLQAALYSDDPVPADHFTGLDHLEGETVSIWGDGRVHPTRVVTGGAITLERAFNTVIIGLNYIGRWRSVKLAYGAQLGTALTLDKSVGNIGFAIRDTPLDAVGYGRTFEEALTRGQEDSDGNELRDPDTDDEGDFVMDGPLELVSGDFNQPFGAVTDIDARICIVMDTPAPVKILGMVPGVELHEHE